MEKLNKDKYISYNEYKEFCKNNNIDINEKWLSERNNKFIHKKLIEYNQYFDNIFTDVGENIKLDEVKNKINDKLDWYRENCKDDYIRQFGDKEIDIFELYSRKY